MLTLQQLLESDSIATLVAKLNQNFQSLSLSNGGPQGIIGKQGIPGLPGRVGPMGVTGPQGPTGTIAGIIPFAAIPGTGTTAGPDSTITETSAYGTVAPWPQSSWQWLQQYHSNGVTIYGVPHVGGATPKGGDIYIDHANKGYWKFLDQPDEPGAHDETAAPPYSLGGAYSSTGAGNTYPALGTQLGWVGPGWYYYPPGKTDAESLNNVWIHDTSTYLLSNLGGVGGVTGPYRVGPNPNNDASLEIPNARLITKYGTVWITSGNDATDDLSDNDKDTSTIGIWGFGSGGSKSQPARNNSGIDRLLFKMSLDGLPYLSNIAARGLLPGEDINIYPDSTYPQNTNEDQMTLKNYWVSPFNGVSIDKYSPLLFLTQRDDTVSGSNATYGSMGIYMYTDTSTSDTTVPPIPADIYGSGTTVRNNNISKTVHLFSSRYSIDPISMYYGGTSTPITSNSTRNFGEMVLDFRRVVASNQYVCSLPTDLKLSSDFIAGSGSTAYYDEDNSSNTLYRYKTNQGYISAINGKSMTGDNNTSDYWEYGLANDSFYTSGTHDSASGTLGMRTRRAWYGSSVLREKPSEWQGSAVTETDYIRVAGMMERGRRMKYTSNVEGGNTAFLSELIFYTSAFNIESSGLVNGVGITNDQVNPVANAHNSLPSFYISPFRNIGIGTFVGSHLASTDQGPLEPSAKLHVHLKQTGSDLDPTQIYKELSNGSGLYSTLPRRTYAVAAFSGDVNPSVNKGNIDILIGSLNSQATELVNGSNAPVNPMKQVSGGKQLRNAIRSEAWENTNVSTLRFGAQPFAASNSIGRTNVNSYRNEFQIALHPLNVNASDLTNSLTSITGVGIHNAYPRARVHFFGKNLNNEVEYGVQPWTPGYMTSGIGTSFPYYGASSVNAPSANQVIVDYIGDSYKYPVGLYEYQYYVFNIANATPSTTGLPSPNSAVYPSKELLSPTRSAVPYGPITLANQAYPSTNSQVVLNNSYKHGGVENAWWEPSSFIGFNLFRDLSSADGNTFGDNRDSTRWVLGTQGSDGRNHGNNGGAGIISSNMGELGIITIPRGRDGGRAYEEWEQRGLGTRDVLNQMKIIFDRNGNIAIGNAAGWDLDAYPSTQMNRTTGYLNYVPVISPTTSLPANALDNSTYTYSTQVSGARRYGGVNYTAIGLPADSATASTSAQVNVNVSVPEYIRLEVGAEKAWSRDGRMNQKLGYGYPTNATLVIPSSLISKYVRNSYAIGSPSAMQWTLITDSEGRIVNNELQFTITGTVNPAAPTASNFVVIFPHPTEFNTGGPLAGISGAPTSFIAPAGAMAGEWWEMSTDSPTFGSATIVTTPIISAPNTVGWRIGFIPTTDTKGSANVRLNNFIYGEGYGFTTTQRANGSALPQTETDYTKNIVRQKRQESPKLILSFLERTPNEFEASKRLNAGTDPYLKVSTVIASAQDEVAIREYWIPKTDNTGGTFMVFTDHFGKKEKDSGFDEESIVIQSPVLDEDKPRLGLHLEEVVTQEFLAGYSASGFPYIDADFIQNQSFLDSVPDTAPTRPKDLFPGYVRYYNKTYTLPGQPAVFSSTQYGQLADIAPTLTASGGGSSTSVVVTGGSTPIQPNKSSYRITALRNQASQPPVATRTMTSSGWSQSGLRTYHCQKESGTLARVYIGVINSNIGAASPAPVLKFNPMDVNNTRNVNVTTTGSPLFYNNSGLRANVAGNYKIKFSTTSFSSATEGTGWFCAECDDWEQTGNTYYTTTRYKRSSQPLVVYTIPSSGEVQLSLNAGEVITLETEWGGNKVFTEYICSFSCSSITANNHCYFNNSPSLSVNGTVELYYLDAPCSQDPADDTMVKMAIGVGSNSLFQKPNNTLYPCPVHTMINVYDTISTNSGTHNGSLVNHYTTGANNNYIMFQRNAIDHDYDGVKITVNLAARTPNNNAIYTSDNKDLIIRFMYVSGYTLSSFADGSLNMYINGNDKDVVYGIIPGRLTTEGKYEYDGTVELYMDRTLWESQPYWALCGAFFKNTTAAPSTSVSNFSIATSSGDAWEIDRLSVTFEELISETTAQSSTNTTVELPIPLTSNTANASSIRRNIDHFYSIFSPDTNYDGGWNTLGNAVNVPEINNHASSIRMKRINSEFALVDFNITVKVDNPFVGETAADGLIDFGSPRFTQYLRFTYIPDEAFYDEDNFRQDIAQDLYGNGMWFSNWSSYKNWLPGTAIVGDDISNGSWGSYGNQMIYNGGSVGSQRKNIASDWSPTYNDRNGSLSASLPFVRTWNGNILEMLAFRSFSNWQEMGVGRASSDYSVLYDPLGNINGNGNANITEGQAIYSAFGNDGRMLRMSNTIFNLTTSNANTEAAQKQKAFAGYLGGMYALWGNQAFERNTNVQWRMAPAYNYTATSEDESSQDLNNGFTLEVQFSKPILHVDTPFGGAIYGYNATSSTPTVQPYRYLTVSGQGIVRYTPTLKESTSF